MSMYPFYDLSTYRPILESSYSATPIEVFTLCSCRSGAADKTAVIGYISHQGLLSRMSMIDMFILDKANVKSFVNAGTDTTLHFDLVDGKDNLIKLDFFTAVNLGAMVTADATDVAVRNAGDPYHLKRYYINPECTSSLNSDGDISILSNLSYFPMRSVLRNVTGSNDKKVIDPEFAKVTPTLAGYEIIDTYSFSFRIRVSSASALTCKGRDLLIRTKAMVNCSILMG